MMLALDGPATAAADGASQAAARLEAVYGAEAPRLCGLGRLLTGDPGAGEDLAQEVFAVALRRSCRDPDYLRDPAWPWLRTTLVRLAIRRRRLAADELRRLIRAHVRVDEDVWTRSTLDYCRALATLPPRMRACVALFYGEDLSTETVAQTLGCSPKTVENQLREARARLRPLLVEVS